MREKSKRLSDRLLDFAVNVIKIAEPLPTTVVGRHVGGQLVKAGTSAGSNYEEACGAESRFDFAHKMIIVLKELKESRFWLRVIRRTDMLVPGFTEPTLNECEELFAIVAKSIITSKGKKISHC